MSADVRSILRSRPVGRRRGEDGDTRCVYVNLPAPEGAAQQHGVVTNRIRTTKYTIFTFLPKNLFEQFRRAANVYFLLMAALQLVPYFQVSSVLLTLFPICFVLALTAAKDGFEDWKRHQQDRDFNNTPTSTLQRWRNVNFEREEAVPPGWRGWLVRLGRRVHWPWKLAGTGKRTESTNSSRRPTTTAAATATGVTVATAAANDDALEQTPNMQDDRPTVSLLHRANTYAPSQAAFQPAVWKDVRIGDIVLLRGDDPVPADLVVLSSSEPDGECYVETKNLDGETNLKTRRCVQETAHITDAVDCAQERLYVESEAPTSNLYLYRGTLHIAQRAHRLLSSNFKSIRLDQNNTLLRGSIVRNTEWVIALAIFTGDETKIMLNAGATPSKRSRIEKLMNRQVSRAGTWLTTLCPGTLVRLANRAALIVFQNIIPISLYISIEFVKTFHAFWIFSDLRMYDEENDQPCVPKTWNISDDLGQVEYVFSDKTGTLTRNIMEFRRCSIRGRAYGDLAPDEDTDAARGARMRAEDEEEDAEAAKQNERQIAMRRLQMKQHSVDQLSLNPSMQQLALGSPSFTFTTRTQAIREYYMALALCHTVIVERPDEDSGASESRIRYRAESPDEDALVSAARDVGFAFLGRRRNELIVDIFGRTHNFELLNLLPFDSTRKRMSVIVRRPAPWNDIVLYIKGADNVIFERLAPGQDTLIAQTNVQLEGYSRDGLRVMLLGCKRIAQDDYDDWLRGYQAASTSMVGRDALLNACAEEIEQGLTLIGATAIEDKLQDEVPDVIASLRRAGIKVWVLTGDKLETAINIGYSCNLLTHEMQLWTVRGGSEASETVEEFIRIAKRVMTSNVAEDPEHREQALVIDGQALKDVLDNPRSRRYLLSMSTRCRSVICCRVSPLQKAQVVHLVRKGRRAITLAIGDGANDVSMIQTANIGVAITGQEGLQAAMSSDYTIAQFRFLKPLLLIHGHWSYLRVSEMILNFFYKNVLYAMAVFFYQIYCGFSADIFCDYIYVQLYNLVFTLLPVLILGCCDQSINAPRALHYPQLYKLGINQERYNMTRFWLYIVESVAHGAIIFFVFYSIYSQNPPMHDGFTGSIQDFSSAVITVVVVIASLFVGFNTYAWNWMMHAAVWGTIVVTVLFLVVISEIESANLYGVASIIYSQANFWLAVVLSIVLSMLPRYTFMFVKQRFFPEDLDIVREIQKLHLDGIQPQQHYGADSAFEPRKDSNATGVTAGGSGVHLDMQEMPKLPARPQFLSNLRASGADSAAAGLDGLTDTPDRHVLSGATYLSSPSQSNLEGVVIYDGHTEARP
ncbi:hypothetical protein THASP1DRAFT_12761 [Thamnocephalis sphaerospora]|uniref:Phospholipid-transporting ATPase n=1 Tax=Thamnocephalis sphaerospora TaxID=78915 RepID=A0A4P9XW02_9FUNG|nr:hypothetical protein THASP1DRAFT_12761 [Thamnocephalis sphaerospora]|eukprot:RKP10485.1 hypothetical protein THASP1DRAFT_12761 [Thamnocephalis sphaerospora]